jgi:hypothetical protein
VNDNLDQIHMDDLKADLASAIERYGARALLLQFRESFPNHYNELLIQINRANSPQRVPAILMRTK